MRHWQGWRNGLAAAAMVLAGVGCGAGGGEATAEAEPIDEASRRLRVLWLGDNGSHQPAVRARQLVPAMLDRNIAVHYTEDIDALTYENMADYDALMIYANITEISEQHEAALLDYVESGGGLVAVHSASFCFHNSDDYIDLVGAQFQSHGAEVFRTRVVDDEAMPPAFKGYEGFESWDETYEHHRHNEDRTVFEYREDEPYSWLREHGEGRVFYTAWGHDHRTFEKDGFQELIERGIRWSAGQDVQAVLAERELHQPFEYEEEQIAYYPPGEGRAGDGEWTELQLPLSPEDSMKRYVLPAGFELELFAAEPDIGKPICMAWDERGRLWIAETRDYPNEVRDGGEGRDRIRILEDTTGDGRADKFTTFADGLNIPTSITFANGGVIVHQAPQTLFLKDTDGDDQADERHVLFDGWSQNDTHAGPSNMLYGLDNWIWGTVGYAGFNGEVGGEQAAFRQGVYRFQPDGSEMEFLRSTNNNTWGLGLSEEGLVFPSTANNNPSDYMPIPRRYFEQVEGMQADTLGGIANRSRFLHMTDRIRQVDVHGGYTSAAGHALYTARTWPEHYWNRLAFVADPTGNLVGQFVLEREGADVHSYNPSNLLASDDEWASPVMAEVGPDGNVWVIDWYAFIVQHNPTPAGYETGEGNAYETDLRDHQRGRIYRVVYRGAEEPDDSPSLHDAGPDELVATLEHENLFWRRHAQRLLVERGERDVQSSLIELVQDKSTDALGLNAGAIHALWTLHGLGAMADAEGPAVAAAVEALAHPSAGVRRNAVQVLPAESRMTDAILQAGLLTDGDAQVRLAAGLALADQPASDAAGQAIYTVLKSDDWQNDALLEESLAFAAVQHMGGFLAAAHSDPDFHARHEEEEEPEHGPNLLADPSFEEGEGEEVADWSPRHYSGEAEQTVDEGRERGRSLRINSSGGADSSWHTRVDVEPNTTYQLSAWIRTEDLEAPGGAHGALLNVHELQSTPGNRTEPLTGTNDWQRVETTFNSGGRDWITINCLFGGWGHATGTAWFDDVALVAVDSPANEGALGRIVGIIETHARAQSGEAVAKTEEVVDGDTRVVEVGVVPDVLRYDRETITVEAGQKVRLVFENEDHMQHNLLILKPGSLERVGAAADAMAGSADAIAKDYVPETGDVLFHTPMLNPQQSYTLEFTAPEEPGEYPFVCTFPGHWRIMNGTLVVE